MVLGLLTIVRMGRKRSRRRWSVAGAIQIVRRAAREGEHARADTLLTRLANAVMYDNRQKRKAAWYYPHKKHPRPPDEPRVRDDTPRGHKDLEDTNDRSR